MKIVLLIATALTCCNLAAQAAQDYPTRPVRIVTPPAGAGNDFVARVIAQGFRAAWASNWWWITGLRRS